MSTTQETPTPTPPASSNSHEVIPTTSTSLQAQLSTLRTIFSTRSTHPPLGWPWVHAFESLNNLTLPEPYRTFLAEIASSCRAGPPDYGLQTPKMLKDEALALPFPLTEAWCWEDDNRDEDDPEYKKLHDQAWENGSIDLGTDGCGIYWHLIVSGECRGQVWNLCEMGAAPLGREWVQGEVGGAGFLGWVEHWDRGLDWWGEREE